MSSYQDSTEDRSRLSLPSSREDQDSTECKRGRHPQAPRRARGRPCLYPDWKRNMARSFGKDTPSREIAARLGVSTRTVQRWRQRVGPRVGTDW